MYFLASKGGSFTTLELVVVRDFSEGSDIWTETWWMKEPVCQKSKNKGLKVVVAAYAETLQPERDWVTDEKIRMPEWTWNIEREKRVVLGEFIVAQISSENQEEAIRGLQVWGLHILI